MTTKFRSRKSTAASIITDKAVLDTRPLHQKVHPVTHDGRVMHYYEKIEGRWTCVCGDRA